MNTRMLKDIYGNNVIIDAKELKRAYEKMEFEYFIKDLNDMKYKLQKDETYESIYEIYKKYFYDLSVYEFVTSFLSIINREMRQYEKSR